MSLVWKQLRKLSENESFEVWHCQSTDDMGHPPVEMSLAYTPDGAYVGNPKEMQFLLDRGIRPETIEGHEVCSIGFSEKEQKWFGWSHRASYGFGVGDVVKEGDCCASSGWTDEYLAEHPEEATALPVGYVAHDLEMAKKMAIAFAESVG